MAPNTGESGRTPERPAPASDQARTTGEPSTGRYPQWRIDMFRLSTSQLSDRVVSGLRGRATRAPGC